MSSAQGEGGDSNSNPESPAPLAFPCNMRAHVGAGDGYYGNCVVGQLVPPTRGAMGSSSIGNLIRLFRRAKEKAPDLLPSSSNSEAAAPDEAATAEAQQLGWHNGLVVVSCLNLGFDAADFGGGGVARVMWHEEQTLSDLHGVPAVARGRGERVVAVREAGARRRLPRGSLKG
ncbi:hypothetical protein BAE44_0023031 [Dichanthelium oligosanthes]|uniref:Uncharacterized protein n=1 Tax=Dichanthelium oligosanthes TaxID=888268 RepID=A0A1E5USR8_9POAL|nr:hypothetical protein BAE44_0023031 [Dichanthelium oligosanthes]